MDIIEYKQLCVEEIISFIESAHKAINKTIDLVTIHSRFAGTANRAEL